MNKIIKFHGLESWFNSLDASEKKLLIEKYGDYDADSDNMSAACFLAQLSSFVNTKENAILCGKIIHESERLLGDESPDSLYYIFCFYVAYYYKNRDTDDNENIAVDYMEKAVGFSSQAAEILKKSEYYTGAIGENPIYKQLLIVYKKRKEWGKIIELCKKGTAEGWGNDFKKAQDEAEAKL